MPTASTVGQAILMPNETTWSAAMPAAPTIGQTIGNVAQGIGQTAQNVAANPLGSVVNAAVSVIHELPRLRQAVDLGLSNPLAPRGSPGQKLATYWAQTDPSQPVNVRLGQALDLAQQDQAKLMDWSAQHADPTRGLITGIGRVPAIGGAAGGLAGAGYALATGASPEQTAQTIETGANLGMLGGVLGEGIANIARGVRGRLSATADAQNAIGGENNAVKLGGVAGEPTGIHHHPSHCQWLRPKLVGKPRQVCRQRFCQGITRRRMISGLSLINRSARRLSPRMARIGLRNGLAFPTGN
jgi:hypothetical protein